jgi:hypothetical protein
LERINQYGGRKMFQLPPLLPPEMPREKRLELIRSVGAKAKEGFITDVTKTTLIARLAGFIITPEM